MGTITVTKRTLLGKSACKKVRKQGQVPGVIYGEKKEIIPIEFTLENLLPNVSHHETVLKLKLEDVEEDVVVKEVQYDTFGEKILHVDFCRIDMTKKINAAIHLDFVGTPKGIQQGGIWEKYLTTLEIKCLPINIPNQIAVKVEGLQPGDSIRVKDIKIPVESAEVVTDPEMLVTTVHLPKGDADEQEDGQAVEPEVITKAKEKE